MTPNVLARLLEARAREQGARLYLRVETAEGTESWTYRRLADEVAQRAQSLQDAGVRRGDRVGVMMAHPGQFIVTWLALLVIDAVAVPVNPRAPRVDRDRTLDIAGSRWLIAPTGGLAPALGGWMELAPDGKVALRQMPEPRSASPRTGAGIILLTSGTTGDPKPVGLPLAALLATARQVAEGHRLTADDMGFSPLPLFHINAEVVAVLAPLVAGAAVVVAGQFHASRFWEIVNRYPITWINAVPSILTVMVNREGAPRHPDRIRFIRSASAPLPLTTLSRVEARWQIPVIETYGLSEAASQVASNPLVQRRAGSVGKPTGTDIRVVDDNGIPCPQGTVGQVEIRGPAVVDPRWGPNRWALAKMRGGWYQTGDLGRFDREGYLYLEGRLRELINRGGEKIFPREVEEAILTHADVVDCAVVGRPHPLLGEEPVAFVVARHGAAEVPEQLQNWVPEHLSRYKCPAQYFVVTTLPKGATGKISRRELRMRVADWGSEAQ